MSRFVPLATRRTRRYPRFPLESEKGKPHDSPVRVWLSRSAYRDLLAWPLAAGVEVAGALFGYERPGLFEVRAVARADKFRRPYSVSLDSSKVGYLAARHLRSGLTLLGTVHSHPHSRGLADPSRADLKSWASYARASTSGRTVGMIATGNEWGGFNSPELTACVLEWDAGRAQLVAAVTAEHERAWVGAESPPVLLVARESVSYPLHAPFKVDRGERAWSDSPTAKIYAGAFEAIPDDNDPNLPWNHRYVTSEGPPSRLPGGWVRRTKPLPVGETVWWEREVRPGNVETYYGDCEPVELVA